MARIETNSDGADEGDLAPIRQGETVAGKYVAGRILGVGGMGVVIEARDALLDRRVAIKFLLPRLSTSERAVQRFIREARAASRINSEHVVRLLEIDTLPGGTPYLVMEYLDGIDLKEKLTRSGPLLAELAVDYVLQALEAIAEGHRRGIVHRDLKPSNLFETARPDGSPLIKVLDFGIAKMLEPDSEQFTLTASDDVRLGSPAYMPPEQLNSPADVDVRSDIWALGVTLYELVCGSPPFQGQTYAELVMHIGHVPPDTPNQRRPGIGLAAELERIILRCLEKDPDHRFASTRELAHALAPFGSDEALASLRRVSGLWNAAELPPASPSPSSGSPPAPASPKRPSRPSLAPGQMSASCTTTLPVAADPKTPIRKPIAADSVKPQRAQGIAFVASALAVGVGIWIWQRSAGSDAESNRDRTEAASAVPAVPVVPAVPETIHRSGAGGSSARAAAGESQAPEPASSASEPQAIGNMTARSRPPSAAATRGTGEAQRSSSASLGSGGAARDLTAESAGGGASSDPGARNPEIERLIETRR